LKGYDDIGITASGQAYFLSDGPPGAGGSSSSAVGGLGLGFEMNFDDFMYENPDAATVAQRAQELQALTDTGLGIEEERWQPSSNIWKRRMRRGYKYQGGTTQRILWKANDGRNIVGSLRRIVFW
ncbi:hypothetical protein Dimus_029611, partial [Dionaea muscipula]